MSDMAVAPVNQYDNQTEVKNVSERPQYIKLNDKSEDSFDKAPEKEKKHSIVDVAIAGSAAVGVGKGVFSCIMKYGENVINGAEKGITNFLNQMGASAKEAKVSKGVIGKIKESINTARAGGEFKFSQSSKTLAKYGAAWLGALAVGVMVFKDSDNDGKSDVIEAICKFFKPGE